MQRMNKKLLYLYLSLSLSEKVSSHGNFTHFQY